MYQKGGKEKPLRLPQTAAMPVAQSTRSAPDDVVARTLSAELVRRDRTLERAAKAQHER